MIARYENKQIKKIWSLTEKFKLWLRVELVAIWARVQLGLVDMNVHTLAVQAAKLIRWRPLMKRIKEIEKDTNHDLLAFVEAVRKLLPTIAQGEFHRGMTSYDTEEIPFMLRLLKSVALVEKMLIALREALFARAIEHKDTVCNGETHGQHAEPITLGVRLLGYVDILDRDLDRLRTAREDLKVGRLAGAVGTYTNMVPEIERLVCEHFGLEPARHSTQILHRDRVAAMAQALALLATNLEHIAYNLWLMARTDSGQVREPFGQKQKGSSAMPHKKNPINLEQMEGMAQMARGRSQSLLESVPTAAERDIAQSCVERVEIPDLFHILCQMLRVLTKVVTGMEVMPKAMLANIYKTQGVIFSPRVKELLAVWQVEPETAYLLLQGLSFKAIEEERPWRDLLLENETIQTLIAADPSRAEAINQCFDVRADLKYIPEIFARFKSLTA